MSATYRTKIKNNQMSGQDWVSFLKEAPRTAVLSTDLASPVEWFYTHIGGEFHITTWSAGTRSTCEIDYAPVEIAHDLERADEVRPMNLSEAPFGELLETARSVCERP